jgi:hypothetical protein
MGLRRGGSSEAGSPVGSEEEKYSMENRNPVSDDEQVAPEELSKNRMRLE